MDFLKSLFSSIVSNVAVQRAFFALLAAVLSTIGITWNMPAPVINNITQPVIAVPVPKIDLPALPTEEDLRYATAPEGEGREGVLVKLARRVAGRQYAREHGLSPQAGIELALAVPKDRVDHACSAVGVEANPPVQGPILDWIKNNPEQFQQIIKIILMLLPLFA